MCHDELISYLVGFEELLTLIIVIASFPLAKLPQNLPSTIYSVLTMSFTVPLVVIFTKFDGQIASEFVNLTEAENEDNWERAREIAEIAFQNIYLHKVLDTTYPPKAYVRLEGENDRDFFLEKGSNVDL